MGLGNDGDAKKLDAQKLNEERFRSYKEHTNEGFYLHETDEPVPIDLPVDEQVRLIYQGKIVDCNDALARMYGKTKAEEVIGWTLADFQGSTDNEENIAFLKYWIENGYTIRGAVSEEVDEDGNISWFSNNLNGVVVDGKLVGTWGTQFDVTELKKAEKELQQQRDNLEDCVAQRTAELEKARVQAEEAKAEIKNSHSRLSIALESSNMGLWEYRVKENAILAADIMVELWGYPVGTDLNLEQIVAKIHPEDVEAAMAIISEALTKEMEYRNEYRVIPSEGQVRWVDARGRSYLGDDGNVSHVIGIALDVTDKKEADEQLLIAKDQAEAANRAKSAFLANMSHEIRTPMNAILGYAQILQHDDSLSSKNVKSLDAISRSGNHLLELINDVLDLSKIEAGRLTLNPTSFDLHRLLEDIETMFKVRAEGKGLGLELKVDESLTHVIMMDERKLTQILINLLGNSMKFTDTGKVTIRASHPSPDSLVFEVEDTGVGISEEGQKRVFEVFEQIDTGKAGGTGLGLSISRQFAKLMGGDITVESGVGKGSVFRLMLPLTEGALDRVKEMPGECIVVEIKPGQPEYRVLVVDDNGPNRDLLSEMLSRVGFKTRLAVNGEEAVEVFKEWGPHVILMDVLMPVMDGVEATKHIRGLEGGKDVSIIAVSASVLEEEKAAILEQGADDFIRKPIIEQELFDSIKDIINIEYVCEEQVAEENVEVTLDTEVVSILPPDLRKRLYDAAAKGQHVDLENIVEEVKEYDGNIYLSLQKRVNEYDYERLIKLFDPEGE